MKIWFYAIPALALLLLSSTARSNWTAAETGKSMSAAAQAFLDGLSDEQKATAVKKYDDESRVDWHFIPKDARKGLQYKDMDEKQRELAMALVKSCLSDVGYNKVTQIMKLEGVLKELEKDRQGGAIRDTERYYFTIFGDPSGNQPWGLSIEGHHLSLNFVAEGDKVVSVTPFCLAANPAELKSAVAGMKEGTRVLAQEETLAFDLLKSLDDDQKKQAVIADKSPREMRTAGEATPPADESAGIALADMTEEQHQIMRRLVASYLNNWPKDVRQQRIDEIVAAGPENVRFAWAGAQEMGQPHYYRIQGPTFVIEFVNTQPDAAGNPANHIHCMWRDVRGDFAIPVKP